MIHNYAYRPNQFSPSLSWPDLTWQAPETEIPPVPEKDKKPQQNQQPEQTEQPQQPQLVSSGEAAGQWGGTGGSKSRPVGRA